MDHSAIFVYPWAYAARPTLWEAAGPKMNLPVARKDEVLSLLPSLKSHMISQLADPEWLAAEVILNEREVRDLIPALKRAGATGLVKYPLNRVIY